VPDPNELLRAARTRTPSSRLPGACMSRQEVAEAANTWLAKHSDRAGAMDAHYVGKLERGVVRWPNHGYRAALRATLKAATDDELGFARAAPRDPVDDVNRKTFLRVALGTGAGVWLAQNFPSHDSSDLLEAVAGPTASYRRMEQAVPTDQLAPAVDAHLRLASSVIAEAVPTASGYAVLSETIGLGAWLAVDRGDPGAARRYYAAAVQHAQRAHHPLLVSYMLASLGSFAVESGDARQGLALLRRARGRLGKDAPETARAWLASLHAIAHASIGDGPAALDQLRDAERYAARHRGEPSWPWVFAFDSAKAARYQATTLAALGDATAARGAYAAASPALTAPKARAIAQIEHAHAVATDGHVDEACALALAALSIGRRYRSERITQRVRAFRATLPADARDAGHLDDVLADLYTEPTA
jgi:hypothetical protein